MTVLLVVLLFTFMVAAGFWIMRRIDRFIESGGFTDSPEGRRKSGLLIYGSHIAYCCATEHGVCCTELKTPLLLQDDCCFSALLILSENDIDNLSLCRIAHANDPDLCLIVRCNNGTLKNVYDELGACRIIMSDENTDEMLNELWRILK